MPATSCSSGRRTVTASQGGSKQKQAIREAFSPADTKITPGDSAAYGASLFEHLLATFAAENVIFLAGLWVYTTSPPAACTAGVQRRPSLLKVVSAVVVAQQAQFCSAS